MAKYFSTLHEYRNHPHNDWGLRLTRSIAKLFLHKMDTVRLCGKAEDEEGPVLYICNHAKVRGPLSMMTFFDRKVRPWVISNVCFLKTYPAFARLDFFPWKSRAGKALAWLLSYITAPFAVLLFSGCECIPSFFDKRIIYTLKKTVETLEEGVSVLIFPEERKYYSKYIEKFQSGFAVVAKQYYKKTGKILKMVPVYVSHYANSITVGEAEPFDPNNGFELEKQRLAHCMRDRIEEMAENIGGPALYSREGYKTAGMED